ncbi:MAG: mandelate racemase/muconate lactonizing enzyme family protein [Planctomycetes bacterium]|nr:mandelate racemase/muconate lactonizing enzyme family protein [Planctomycetota bacterium]
MKTNRRHFLQSTLAVGAALSTRPGTLLANHHRRPPLLQLDQAAAQPVLKRGYFKDPVKIASVDLLRNGKEFFLRATSTDGAVGYAVTNNARMGFLYPILLQRVIPYFIGKDARDLDALIDGVYIHGSNYKLQGLAFWVCVASVEFALLDLLGQIAQRPVGELLGTIVRKDIGVYYANNYRGKSAQESVELIARTVERVGAKAIKFKLGGRMRNNVDSYPGRTEAMIPLLRKAVGDQMTIYSDSNGSYDAANAIRIGKLLEASNISFFEEPCPFDHLEETKQVADALDIPIAGGEQEFSHQRFRWMIHHGAVQIVQPDLFYYGGFVRAIRVARMAEAAGMKCTPHMSGSTLGYLYVLHFSSCVPNAGEHMEYKGKKDKIPFTCDSSLTLNDNGTITIPSGAGLGIVIDPEFIKKSVRVTQ